MTTGVGRRDTGAASGRCDEADDLPSGETPAHAARKREAELRVIDAHSHFLPGAVLDVLSSGEYPHARVEERDDDQRWVVCTSGLQFRVTPLFTDVEAKLEWMNRHQIDVSLTSTCAPLFLYELAVERTFCSTRSCTTPDQYGSSSTWRDRTVSCSEPITHSTSPMLVDWSRRGRAIKQLQRKCWSRTLSRPTVYDGGWRRDGRDRWI
jgi:hypothetical protein